MGKRLYFYCMDLTQLVHWRGGDHLQIVVPGSRLLPSRMWIIIVRYERSGWLAGKRPASRESDSVGGGRAVRLSSDPSGC